MAILGVSDLIGLCSEEKNFREKQVEECRMLSGMEHQDNSTPLSNIVQTLIVSKETILKRGQAVTHILALDASV